MSVAAAETRRLHWRGLPVDARAALARRLDGLYGAEGDESAFDALEFDKQRALLIFVRRLDSLGLWHAVARVENVYGTGGVGMNFEAWPFLVSTLRRRRRDFTALFAAHRDTTGGFRERRPKRASLHFLYRAEGSRRRWSVHFDLYNPLASPMSAWRHVYHETLRAAVPDWRAIESALADEPAGENLPGRWQARSQT